MASYNELLALIDAYINRNGVQAITGQILNGVLKAMVDQLGRGYTLMGYAEPTGDPGTPDGPESWFASVPGTYTNYGEIQVAAGELALLSFAPSEGWTKNTIYEVFREVTATADDNIGFPQVGVTYANGVLSFDFKNIKGEPGENGDPAGFGSVTASVDDQVGTPSVSVSSSGPDTAKNFAFAFHNLKGETGVTSVVATVDNTSGNPQCSVSLQGGQLTLAFTGLKGAQGNTGSSVDYPFTIVNNLTTNDPAQALSAAMGVELDGKVSQLEAEVGTIPPSIIELQSVWKNGTLDGNGNWANTSNRIITSIDLSGKSGFPFRLTTAQGYDVSVRFTTADAVADPVNISGISGATVVWQSDGWVQSVDETIPSNVKSACVIMRRDTNVDLSPSEASLSSITSISIVPISQRLESIGEKINGEKVLSLSGKINWVIGSFASGTGTYAQDSRRLICSIDLEGYAGCIFSATALAGYNVSVRLATVAYFENAVEINGVDSSKVVYDSGWQSMVTEVIPDTVKSAVILLRKTTDADIPIGDSGKASITIELKDISERVGAIEEKETATPDSVSVGSYYGEEIRLQKRSPFYLNHWLSFSLSHYAQSLAVYGDYIVFFYGDAEGSLWRISTQTKIADISFPYTGVSIPHGNTMCFGNEFAPGNTDMPLLYVSQWDNDGGCLVYNLQANGNIALVQTIRVSISDPAYGSNLGDWVVDRDSCFIYSVKYKIASSSTAEGNGQNICKFRLPKLAEGNNIVLTDEDILDFFAVPFMPYNQDKDIHDGKMFVSAGNNTSVPEKIYVLNLGGGYISSVLDLYGYGNEPEGLCILDDGIILGYGFQPQTFYKITF